MDSDQRTVRILLNMGLDEASVKKAMAQFDNYHKGLKELEKEANAVKKALALATSFGENTDELNAELGRINESVTILKNNAKSGLAGGFISAEEAARRMNQELEKSKKETTQTSYNLRDIGEKLSQVGAMVGNAGRAITSPIMGAMNAYLQQTPFDETTQRWQSAQAEIEQSYLRIGAVATDTLLPTLEAAAGLVEKVADFVEANPDIIKAALITGGALQAAGAGLQAAGQMAMLGGSLKALGLGGAGAAIKGGLATAGKAVGGFLGGAGGAALGGIGLGLGGYEALAQSQLGKKAGLANLGQYASVAAYGAGSLFGQGDEWFRWMGEMTGVIEKQTEAAEKNVKSQEIVTQKQLDAFAAYEDAQKKRQDYERSAEEQRNQLIQEFADRRKEIEANAESQRNQVIAQFASQRANLMRQFSQTEQRAEQDYYRQRAQAAQKHGLDVQRAEQDHQRELRKLQRDHNRRVTDLVDERDALGLVREQRSYEDQRQETEQNHRVEMQRRNEDYALQLRDMEANFAQQRQRRLEDYQRQVEDLRLQEQQRLAQMEAQKAIELQKLEELEKQKLAQFEKNYKAELEQLRAAEQSRLATLRSVALNDNALLQRAGMEMTARYRAWLQQAAQNFLTPISAANFGSRPPQYRAAGGWVEGGAPYIVGERGPELFVPRNAGTIVPNHEMMSNRERASAPGSGGGLNMRIETNSLTLNQVIREIDKRLGKNNRALAGAFGG